MLVTLDCETFLLWAKTNFISSNADVLRVPTDTHRWNTTTMCAQWVITLMAAEWLRNVWAFYAIVRSDFTQHSYWIIAADPIISRPFRARMSHTQTPAVTQVWVTENDLPLWVTWHSTSCNMKLQLQEPNCDGWCAPTCAWWNQRITLSSWRTCGQVPQGWGCVELGHFYICAVLFWHVRVRPLQTACHRWVHTDSEQTTQKNINSSRSSLEGQFPPFFSPQNWRGIEIMHYTTSPTLSYF